MEFNSGEIPQIVEEIDKLIKKLHNEFQSGWNDSVHESFKSYLILCEKNGKKLGEIDLRCQQICKGLNELKVDEKLNYAKKTIEEADKLIKEADRLMARRV